MPPKNEDQKSDQTAEKPRKKKCVEKRKAGSSLNDADYTNNANNTQVNTKASVKGKKKGGCAINVSKNNPQNEGFPFKDPVSNPFSINFSSKTMSSHNIKQKQAASSPKTGPFSGAMLGAASNVPGSQTPNIPPSQPSIAPNWLPELINDVKQIKLTMSKLDQIEKTVNTINMKVTDLETKVNHIEPRVTEVENSCSFTSNENDIRKKELEKVKSEIVKLKYDCSSMKSEADILRQKNANFMESKVTDLESGSMRQNLLFYGIPEKGQNEDCEELVKQVCVETLDLYDAERMKFDRVHRIGTHSTSRIRPIVAKFHNYKDRERVRQRAYEKTDGLKTVNLGIGQQWPSEVRDKIKTLFPIMQREKSNGKKSKNGER